MAHVKIKAPRNGAYQPFNLRQRRNLKKLYTAGVIAILLCLYFYNPFASGPWSFEKHAAYMNERAHTRQFVSQQSYDWRKAPFYNKIESYIPLPTGTPRTLPRIQFDFPEETRAQAKFRTPRQNAVRNEFKRVWDSYRKLAWPKDELMPVSGAGLDTFGGWGATLVDTLDTLWIMGFKKEFYEAVGAVARIDFGKADVSTISVFETTIRYLGGLLSAYDLSGEKVLLEKAVQLGEMLYRAFDTENNTPLDRLPLSAAQSEDGEGFSAESSICLAAIGSLTMEFTRLAQVTQEPKYYDAVARITTAMEKSQTNTTLPGLFPTWIRAHNLDFSTDVTYTMGAMADSAYEYFPKMHALLGGLDPAYEKIWKTAAPAIDKHLLFRPMLPDTEPGAELLFSGDLYAHTSPSSSSPAKIDPEMQHLTCFIGGMFALAGRLFESPSQVDIGAKLTEGCIYAYSKTPTGIMPEKFQLVPCDSRISCPWNATLWEEEVRRKTYGTSHENFLAIVEDQHLPPGFTYIRDKRYLLRPEAIESVFIMYRITGHEEYLVHAWDMFTHIQSASATTLANGQVMNVMQKEPWIEPEDKMESFWTAETLKYFYLVFSPPGLIDLDDWVFNTEAHPFRRPKVGVGMEGR
ncbi:glycoside hydrolase family 47 protein [Sporormia fimetaria CBS 119925]|uniref:alpha-1,2-Mannosidase n=1 Tax=Sporormia fimetaria CBS 119925 TaxID=1340428 RepID=A0A6A6VGK1_9PLEO|nr:glycoside hydrolase family 47 protein [Sporormia fimetaria CBS 119925]